jgi:alpha-L-arabinofuranosidase
VMKLWRDHYATQRIALSGEPGTLNAVATKSADGHTLYLKAVNPATEPVKVSLAIEDGFAVGKASIESITPDSLEARNTLDAPHAIRSAPGKLDVSGQRVRFEMPRWSVGVVTITRK